MGKIIILDENTSNKIAAGEVVERPASVVKELVENSIDAGAESISVEIKNGGISYIKVVDNGSGIDEDDIEIAFERHATSKIRNADDLDSIMTMGFRGEALASIASVSSVEVSTRVRSKPNGTYIRIQGGVVKEVRQTGCPAGTAFTVRDLFFNTPARFKFLKKDSTEAGYVSDIVNRIALANPQISFRLTSNHSQVVHTPGNNDLLSTIFSIYGKEIAQQVVEINYEENGIKITGYAGKPEISRATRSHQTIFVNGRYIRSKLIGSAIDEAYKTLLMKNKFAFIVLNIDLNPLFIDINVHPTKMEVRFSEEQKIFRIVYHAINNALLGTSLIRTVRFENRDNNVFKFSGFEKPEVNFSQQKIYTVGNLMKDKTKVRTEDAEIKDSKVKEPDPETSEVKAYETKAVEANTSDKKLFYKNDYEYNGKTSEAKIFEAKTSEAKVSDFEATEIKTDGSLFIIEETRNALTGEKELDSFSFAALDDKKYNKKAIGDDKKLAEPSMEAAAFLSDCTVIGQAFSTYIILQQEDELILIDQHAAHERIIYEQMKKRYLENESLSQELIAPIVIEVTNPELKLLQEEKEFFNKLGFIFEDFGNNSIILRSVPFACIDEPVKSVFMDVVDNVMKVEKDSYSKIADDAIYSMACKAAVKANKRLDEMEIKKILKDLDRLDNPYTCPHGRPTIVRLTRYELEKMFKRIV